MVREAEEFAEEDKIIKDKIDTKNSFQNYIYQMRNTIEDKTKLADKLDTDDKNTIAEALTEAEDWLNSNQDAEKDEYFDAMTELQSICNPIVAKIYDQQGG